MCALTWTDVFAAGACYFGIADLVPFASGDTHKFESRYEHMLVGPWPEAEADSTASAARSTTSTGSSTPMLVLQGTDDEVVPPVTGRAHRRRAPCDGRSPHAYLLFEGEGHGFRQAATIVGGARGGAVVLRARSSAFDPASDIATARDRHREAGSAADHRHRARRLDEVGVVHPVARPLRPDGPHGSTPCELVVGRSLAHRPAQVGLLEREQARCAPALGGEPQPVARVAEGLGDAGDDADPPRGAVGEPVGGGGLAGLAFGDEWVDGVDRLEDPSPRARPCRAPTRAGRRAACTR